MDIDKIIAEFHNENDETSADELLGDLWEHEQNKDEKEMAPLGRCHFCNIPLTKNHFQFFCSVKCLEKRDNDANKGV
mgnify:FL=1|tara:strand:+ start:5656 stop:5886 length:231 start_codon:yes stop_codon:yes gene_type:complete